MWRLIKAEFKYYGIPYILLFGIVLVFFLANTILGYLEQFFALIMFISAFLIGLAMNAEWSTTYRVRFLSGLPLPVRKLEILRSAGGILTVWLIWALLLSLSSLISQQGHIGMDYICWVLTKIASIFILVVCGDLAMNTRYCLKSTGAGSVLLWVSSLVILLAGSSVGFVLYFFTIPGPSFFSNLLLIALSEMFLTLPVSFGLFLLGLALTVLDIYVFGVRKSYLEESSWLTASRPKWKRLLLVSKP